MAFCRPHIPVCSWLLTILVTGLCHWGVHHGGLSSVEASCGHYVVTKFEWMAVRAVQMTAADANQSSVNQLYLQLDSASAAPRFWLPHQRPLSPCQGPGCRQLPDQGPAMGVLPNPVDPQVWDLISISEPVVYCPTPSISVSRKTCFCPQAGLSRLFRPPQA